MCSVLDPEFNDGVQDIPEDLELDIPEGSVCKKCDINLAVVILRGKDVYCEECFLAATNHKFRAVLGKTRLIRPGDLVALAYSGNDTTSALVELVRKGLAADTHKKLRFNVVVIYINENLLKINERYHLQLPVYLTQPPYNFKVFAANLSESLNTNEVEVSELPAAPRTNDVLDSQLKSLYCGLLSHTSKQDFLKKIKSNLILRMAKKLNCPWTFLGDIGDDIAATLLNNIVLGRGAHLPLDVGLCDARDSGFRILRPMKDFIKKEIAYFNSFNKIVPMSTLSLRQSTKTGVINSIQDLTESFVANLQKNFPATVSTVFRTSEKLSGTTCSNSADEDDSCVFCKAPLDTHHVSSSSLQATGFSRLISAEGKSYDQENHTEIITNGKQDTVDQYYQEIEEYLCYGCRIVLRESKHENIPNHVLNSVQFRKKLVQQRKDIEDYLL